VTTRRSAGLSLSGEWKGGNQAIRVRRGRKAPHPTANAIWAKPSAEPPATEEELRHLLELGRKAGVFERAEQEIVERVLRLGDRSVGELVTPRSQLVALDVDDPVEVNLRKIVASGHTFYPVYEGNPDHVLGLISVKILLARATAGEPFDLRRDPSEAFGFKPATKIRSRFLDVPRRRGEDRVRDGSARNGEHQSGSRPLQPGLAGHRLPVDLLSGGTVRGPERQAEASAARPLPAGDRRLAGCVLRSRHAAGPPCASL
jgi:hypothetical protein